MFRRGQSKEASSSSSSSHRRTTPTATAKALRKPNVFEIPPEDVIQKIVQHSRDSSSPRLLKYLTYAKKNFSSSNLKIWMDLRKKGGLHSVETVIKKGIEGSAALYEDKTTIKLEVFSNCLSILGNAYSLDYVARKDVASSGFIAVLHRLIELSEVGVNTVMDHHDFQECTSSPRRNTSSLGTSESTVTKELPERPEPPFSTIECDIKTKAIKCIANLAHDSNCRDGILKSGVGITILKILERFNLYWNKYKQLHQCKQELEIEAEGAPRSSKFVEDFSECAKASVRAIRILSSESRNEDATCHLIRFGAVTTMGHILSWALHEDLKLDVLRSLANLTEKIRLLPSEQVKELVSDDGSNPLLKVLITVFEECSVDAKWFCPTIRCLTNFAANTRIAEAMGRHLIFRVALEKLRQTTLKSSTEICRLLVTLTKYSGVNQCLLYNCQEIWTTLQILRCDGLQEHHRWLLHVYENVYEGSLKSLLRNGLIELIHDHFKKELEDCDYNTLKSKIMSLDATVCKVHGGQCLFMPTYRCDSPSYQQVQEDMKIIVKDRDLQYKMDVDYSSSGVDSSSSPSSSPARSYVSSDDSGSESSGIGIHRSNSPTSSISDDDGCYSPVYSSISLSPTYSEGSPSETSFSPENSWSETITHHRQLKYPRLDTMSHIPFLDEDQIVHNTTKKTDSIKNKSKKIVVMLNILQKCSFLTPIPSSMADITSTLLSFIVRGIVSLTPQKYNYQDHSKDMEMTRLGRRSFSLAYRILKTMCLNIHFFPEMVNNGTISIVFRLLRWDKLLTSTGNVESISTLLDTLHGKSNDTSGWRQGHLLRTLLISKSEDELTKASLTIPLLFRTNDHVLRNFESKGQSWTRVFELLTKSEDLDLSLFQDCILSLSALAETIHMKYDASDTAGRPKLLKSCESNNINQVLQFLDLTNNDFESDFESDGRVKITLDDGSCCLILKDILTQSSPVFSAMFDGHFSEAGSQTVAIPNVSKESLKVLVEQLQILNNSSQLEMNLDPPVENVVPDTLDLSSLFELMYLSDQFLLESLYERTLNTLLSCYICPYSAPRIYAEAVKLCALWKPQSRIKGWDMDLTFVVLKYLLVGDLTITSRCGAFRKIFDNVPSETIVGDMRALVECYISRPW